MKKLFVLWILSIFLLMGCSGKTTNKVENTDSTKETHKINYVENIEDFENTNKSELTNIMEILGKGDKEASSLLGGGKENKTEDGYLIGRIYETGIFHEDVSLYTSYDTNGKVNTLMLNLAQSDATYYVDLISKELNIEPKVDSDSSESGTTVYNWDADDKIISIYDSFGLISLEIILPDE